MVEENNENKKIDEEDEIESGSGLPLVLALLMAAIVGAFTVKTMAGDFFGFFISFIPAIIVFVVVGVGVNVNNQWEEAVILRMGSFQKLKKQGLFVIIPAVDQAIKRDMRVRSTTIVAEDALTSDKVPVNVDAVIFWKVVDSIKSVVDIQDYYNTTINAAKTTLRDTIGKSSIDELNSNREELDTRIKKIIYGKVVAWGIDVTGVEIKEVKIPQGLQDAMSRQAQASMEKQARITLSESETEIAKKFEDASKIYRENPEAMQLRGLSMLYETIKNDKSTVVVVPSDAVSLFGQLMKKGDK